jgi:chemotaxis response regulator CheB
MRMGRSCALSQLPSRYLTKETHHAGDRPAAGRWLLAVTNDHLMMTAGQRLRYTPEPKGLSFRPSIDI